MKGGRGLSPRLATYRVQLGAEVGFESAATLAPYLQALGVSHLYCSPALQAAPGSTHGYDVADASRLSEALGGAAAFAVMRDALSSHGLRVLLDIVPNHMAAHAANPWWWEVLRSGRSSAAAAHFDVDWDSVLDPATRGRVMLPVLADDLPRVIDEVAVARRDDGAVVARYHEHEVPLPGAALDARGDALLALLDAQHYRLAHWRLGLRALNYRRFFDITSLVALRAEREETFAATHALVLDMLRGGDLDGLRVDHVDGLRDPAGYLRRLRDAAGDSAWLVVEKILALGEDIPDDWPVQGTTGYEFAAMATRLLVHPGGEAPLFALHAELGGQTDLDAAVRAAKLQVLRDSLAPDLERLTLLRGELCPARTRDEVRSALAEEIAALPVYRGYAVPGAGAPEAEYTARLQQLSAAAMAKGMEDTAFYRVTPLLALDEVGCAPQPFSASADDLHRHNARAQLRHPEGLLALSTHDTKRSADVRARLALLSEMPAEWAAQVRAWRGRNRRHRRGDMPDAVMEHFLYQSLVGAWPISLERMLSVMEKASREAKLHTSWLDPAPDYEAALRDFVAALYGDAAFVAEVEETVRPLLSPGRVNALAALLLQLTSPGVPDVYQGDELWNLALVDPDNRRPVDFAVRAEALERSRRVSARDAWTDPVHADSGLPKLLLLRRALALRRRHPEAFGAGGDYAVLPVAGARAAHVVAFARGATPAALTVVPRWPVTLGGDWGGTAVALPEGEWHDQLTGAVLPGGDAPIAELLRDFPVALLAADAAR